ncbi:MAG: hypothetical protein BYD32DRAFT_415048 [Podila humilis]|nr:MAG: hypothetical protein BYD32DRAFT_415048 [Podila humilis]
MFILPPSSLSLLLHSSALSQTLHLNAWLHGLGLNAIACATEGKKEREKKLKHHPSYIEHVQNVWGIREGERDRQIEKERGVSVCVCRVVWVWCGCCESVCRSEQVPWMECLWLLLTSDIGRGGGCVRMSLFNMVCVCASVCFAYSFSFFALLEVYCVRCPC